MEIGSQKVSFLKGKRVLLNAKPNHGASIVLIINWFICNSQKYPLNFEGKKFVVNNRTI